MNLAVHTTDMVNDEILNDEMVKNIVNLDSLLSNT